MQTQHDDEHFLGKLVLSPKNSDVVLSIVDTPAYGDSQGNILARYLRGCGGVNLFRLFFDLGSRRFDQTFENLLKYFVKVFGKTFWKHCIIIYTKSDVVDDEDLSDSMHVIFIVVSYYLFCNLS